MASVGSDEQLVQVLARIETGLRYEVLEILIVRLHVGEDVNAERRTPRLLHLRSCDHLGIRHDQVDKRRLAGSNGGHRNDEGAKERGTEVSHGKALSSL